MVRNRCICTPFPPIHPHSTGPRSSPFSPHHLFDFRHCFPIFSSSSAAHSIHTPVGCFLMLCLMYLLSGGLKTGFPDRQCCVAGHTSLKVLTKGTWKKWPRIHYPACLQKHVNWYQWWVSSPQAVLIACTRVRSRHVGGPSTLIMLLDVQLWATCSVRTCWGPSTETSVPTPFSFCSKGWWALRSQRI